MKPCNKVVGVAPLIVILCGWEWQSKGEYSHLIGVKFKFELCQIFLTEREIENTGIESHLEESTPWH